MKNCINYILIADALEYYRSNGYRYIDLDWTVLRKATDFTMPSFAKAYTLGEKDLVGSAEQTFIQMILDGELKPGKYCGITPCFRPDNEDELHGKYFLKLELIDTESFITDRLHRMIRIASCFFGKFLDVQKVETSADSFDLQSKALGIELGSYGKREKEGVKWIYGTGLAEPRFTVAYDLEIRRRKISKLFSHKKKVLFSDLRHLFGNDTDKLVQWIQIKVDTGVIEMGSDGFFTKIKNI